ncbi:MAG: hypothetical protein SNH63_03845 [Rikenellaceae bacterium]
MKNMNYESPQIEIVEIEVEDAILSVSGTSNQPNGFTNGGSAW